jgi:ethanolamine utilization microcompartment shell protein EutS
MSIISVTPGQVGVVGVLPSIAYIQTTDTVATVTTTGYLNKEVANGIQFSLPCIAAVSTKATPTSQPAVGWYQVVHNGSDWSLTLATNDTIALANGLIFVGNASGVATGVLMSGDASISNTGGITIANNAITTAKIAAAQVTLAKLAAGITPAYIIKLGGKDVSAGGSATVTITATGVVATDLAFAAIQASANAVSIQKVTAATDQVIVLCSGDPGAATICWAAERAAA